MRKLLLRAVFVLGAALLLYVLFFPISYSITARIVGASVTGDVVPPVVLAPQPPRPGDTTMERLLEIADGVTWEDEDPCSRDGDPDEAACRALVARHREVFEQLSAWAEDDGPFGPRQREAAGRHARAPVGVGAMYEIPPLTPQLRLADLLAMATQYAFADGEREAGERTLRLMFDLGAFFEHNPATLLHEMVGVVLTNEAALAAVRSVPAESADAVAVWLPQDVERLLSLQLALGAEWLNLGYFLDHELQGTSPFALVNAKDDSRPVSWDMVETMGLYDPVHTRQMHDAFWAHVQSVTRAPPLRNPEIEVDTWDTMGAAKYFHNPIGRMLFTIAVPGFVRFGERAGDSIDRVAALRVILAARRFHAAEGRWPESPDELGPEWPTSALNGEPLLWDRETNVIRLSSEEGDGLCSDERDCVLPFALPGH